MSLYFTAFWLIKVEERVGPKDRFLWRPFDAQFTTFTHRNNPLIWQFYWRNIIYRTKQFVFPWFCTFPLFVFNLPISSKLMKYLKIVTNVLHNLSLSLTVQICNENLHRVVFTLEWTEWTLQSIKTYFKSYWAAGRVHVGEKETFTRITIKRTRAAYNNYKDKTV